MSESAGPLRKSPEVIPGQGLFIVQIVKDEGNEVVWQSQPTNNRRAEKIADGAGINLNWETHHISVVEA